MEKQRVEAKNEFPPKKVDPKTVSKKMLRLPGS